MRPQPRHTSRKAARALALGLALAAAALPACASSIWFGSDEPFLREAKGRGTNDYMDLYRGNDSWARGVNVINLSQQFSTLGPADQVSAVINFVKAHHMQLSMSALMLISDGTCGMHVEPYAPQGSVERAARRIRDLGGTISFLEMDEPFYYGTLYSGPRACHTPARQVAEALKIRIANLRAIFPNLKIGDDEPVGSPPQSPLPSLLAGWFDTYRAVMGENLTYFHSDIGWTRQNWPEQLQAVARITRGRGIRFGVLFTGSPDAPDDVTWTSQALQRAQYIVKRLDLKPDDAVFGSWMIHPTHLLPPEEPGSLTWVLRAYMPLNR